MFTFRTWMKALIAAMLLPLFSPFALAQRNADRFRTTEASASQIHERAGSPEMGVLIIIGVIGLLVFVAWVFSRIGEGKSRPADGTLN
jgi:UDP-N-acetylmuramyl pentapeptide phosphotransferase/UDP-N-acetylglucosamine-1-phosphate transferase